MIKHTTGNLIDMAEAGNFDVIVHGCNCMCTMGSGIAKEIRQRYPQAYDADYETTMGDAFKLGGFTTADAGKFLIVNAYTQYDFNRKGENKDVFEYASFEIILRKLAYAYGNRRFGFPMIGMGLAGGDKQRIFGLLEWFEDLVSTQGGSVTVVEFG